MMAAVGANIDPDLDFASYYQNGGDPDRDCERLYVWHRALWGRVVPGVGPFELDIVHHRGYGMRLRTADGAEFRLSSDGMIPTWSNPGWTHRFAPDLAAEIARDVDDFYRIAPGHRAELLLAQNPRPATGSGRPHRPRAHPRRPGGLDDQPAAGDPLDKRVSFPPHARVQPPPLHRPRR